MGHVSKGLIGKTIIACHILALAGSFATTPAAAATYDGAWQVQIQSSKANCGGGTSLSLAIVDGQVASGSAMVTASGRVAPAGTINVSLSSGMKHAVGSGRLSDRSGSGTWRGSLCSGTWVAQRV